MKRAFGKIEIGHGIARTGDWYATDEVDADKAKDQERIAELVEAITVLLLLNYEPDDITYMDYTELIAKHRK